MRTIRARITVAYASLFLITGAVLLVLMYVMLSSALEPPKKYDNGYGNGGYKEREYKVPGTEEEWEWQLETARGEQREEALRLVKITAVIALAVAFLGALGVGWLFAGRMLRPVSEITEHTQQLSESTLDQRLNLQGPEDELKQLADTIDDMLGRLEQSFESQKRFAAQASHELRTPLAIMGGEADVTLANPDSTEREKEMAQAIRAQVNRSQRLVEGLLVLARSDANVINRESIDLADLAGDSMEDVLSLADQAQIDVDLELDSAPVLGDSVLLHSLVVNLYMNAMQYNRSGGWVRVKVWSESGSSKLRVENSGDEIPPAEMERLFRPFQRGRGLDQDDRQKGGFGLGMAIVRSVTAVHNGVIQARPRDGGGLDITVEFPSNTIDKPYICSPYMVLLTVRNVIGKLPIGLGTTESWYLRNYVITEKSEWMNVRKMLSSISLATLLMTSVPIVSAQNEAATPGVIGEATANECVTDLGTAEIPDGATGYTVNGEESQASFAVSEEIAGQGLNEAVGTTNAVIGTLIVDAHGNPLTCSRIDVDLRTLITDESRRDGQIQNALETSEYPLATFIVTEVSGLEGPLVEGEETEFTLVGNLNIHGVDQQVSWSAFVTLSDGVLTGSATTVIQFADFEVEKPVMGPVMSIEDDVSLTIDLVANAG